MVLAVASFGCGGGSSKVYSLDASRNCLAGIGETSTSLDSIAESASAGATRVVVNGKEAMVMFGADTGEATDLAQQYEGVPGGGKVDRQGNAVVAWTDSPTDDEAGSVRDCLQ